MCLEMKLSLMWRKTLENFNQCRDCIVRNNRWKTLNKELEKWREAKKKAKDNYQSGTSFFNHKRWYNQATKKNFSYEQCWEVVKNCLKFMIITPPTNVSMNETPLHDLPASGSGSAVAMTMDNTSMESPFEAGSPSVGLSGPIGKRRRRMGPHPLVTR